MGKGIAALAHLPQIDLILPTGNAAASIEAFKGLANVIAKLQADEVADGTYEDIIARGDNPYDSSTWDITIADSGATFTCTFVEEVVNVDTNLKGRAALSTRRKIDILKETGENVSVRSFLALLNFIEGLEDGVASPRDFAEGTVTLASAAENDTVTVNGLVYTAVTGTKADDTEFSIDGNDTVDAADLADSVNNDTRDGTLGDVSATSAAGVVTFVTNVRGEAGNATTLVSSNGTRLAVSGATFAGGGNDGTYTEIALRGHTPFKTYEWTVVKLADLYTVTSTANSN